MIRRKQVLFALLMIMSTNISFGAQVYSELTDGDLNNFNQIPPLSTTGTDLGTFTNGVNSVSGSFGTDGNGNRDEDVFSFSIPVGFELHQIVLQTYTLVAGDAGNGSYFAIQAGNELGTSPSTVGNNLSNMLVNQTGELLSEFAAGSVFGGQGMDLVLESGIYTFGFSEISAVIDYQLDFHVRAVPIPASFWLFGSSVLAVFGVRRNSRKS